MVCNQWAFASSRCVYACENMAAKIRRIAEDQLDAQSPQLIFSIFVAARFYLGMLHGVSELCRKLRLSSTLEGS